MLGLKLNHVNKKGIDVEHALHNQNPLWHEPLHRNITPDQAYEQFTRRYMHDLIPMRHDGS